MDTDDKHKAGAPPAAARRIKTPEAAAYIGSAEATLNKDRLTGRLGIPFIKIGRAVVYDTTELDRWLESRKRVSTSDAGEAHTQ
jgi:predicted DNA-binding transcriptional regulator AlpA